MELVDEWRGVTDDVLPSGVGIADDFVLDVGDVHDLAHAQSAVLEIAPQHVAPDEGAVVSDVEMAVDGRTAGIHPHLARDDRNECFLFAGQGVEKTKLRHSAGSINKDWRL